MLLELNLLQSLQLLLLELQLAQAKHSLAARVPVPLWPQVFDEGCLNHQCACARTAAGLPWLSTVPSYA